MMPDRMLLTAGMIRTELRALDRAAARAARVEESAARVSVDQDVYLDALALYLHDIYQGFERVFATVADRLDDSTPRTAEWHKDLLDQVALEVPGLRPAVLSGEAMELLDELRRFRHVVRHVYAETFDYDRLR